MELIARLAGKNTHAATTKPVGMSAAKAGQTAVKLHAWRAPTRGNVYARGFGCYQDGSVTAGATVREAKDWRPKFRKGEHWLTRIAEGLKRGWR